MIANNATSKLQSTLFAFIILVSVSTASTY